MIDDIVKQHKLLGDAVTKLVVEHAAALDKRRVAPESTPADIEKLFD